MVKESKINHIMSIYSYRPKNIISKYELREYNLCKLLGKKVKDIEVFVGVTPGTKEHNDRMLVLKFYYKQGKTDKEIQDIWWDVQSKKYSRQRGRNVMPKEGKDNQNPVTNTINGTGGGGWNSIRVPSKKHKNRFKNFKKLFPDYCKKKGL